MEEDPYEEIVYESLPPELQEEINRLNLRELLETQLKRAPLNQPLCRFILRRLAQLRDVEAVSSVLDHLTQSSQLIPECVNYLTELTPFFSDIQTIGRRLIEALRSSPFAQSHHVQMWLLSMMATDSRWSDGHNLVDLYGALTSPVSQRKLMLAMGRAGLSHWFRERKGEWMDLSPWIRRAFLAGASSMPRDERGYWYASIRPRLDPLEKLVVDWARRVPMDEIV